MAETVAEEIDRLRREIGERQQRLQFLVMGDLCAGVTFQSIGDWNFQVPPNTAVKGGGAP